jgi:hypothetical protein
MSTRVYILKRVVIAIAIPVQRLRVCKALHNSVRAYKPANRRIVVAGVVVVQAGLVKPLAGEFLVRVQVAALGTCPTKWEVFDRGDNCSSAVCGYGGAGQAVLLNVPCAVVVGFISNFVLYKR